MTTRIYADSIKPNFTEAADKDGNTIARWFLEDAERYRYDGKLCEAGWEQFDTDQDAWYFGVWVSVELRQIFCFAEGDCTQTFCDDVAHFRAALEQLCAFHSQPPTFITYDTDGTRTEVYAKRLSPEDIT